MKNVIHFSTAILLAGITTGQLWAQDQFIDGFPDIPRLSIVVSIENEAVVFDTPSGTVAEVGLRLTGSTKNALAQYNSALTGLGWACDLSAQNIRCIRGASQVSLTASSQEASQENSNALFILRLEPLQ